MKLSQAIALAADVHADQYDKGGEPYILHPLRVMEDAMRVHDSDELAGITAVLHDVLEDNQKYDPSYLRELIAAQDTDDTLGRCELLTKKQGDDYLADYIPRIIAADDPYVITAKMADLRDNMNIRRQPTLRDKDLLRIQKYHVAYRMLRESVDSLP